MLESLSTISDNIRTISRDVTGLKREVGNFQITYQVYAEIEFGLDNVRNNSTLEAVQKDKLQLLLFRLAFERAQEYNNPGAMGIILEEILKIDKKSYDMIFDVMPSIRDLKKENV